MFCNPLVSIVVCTYNGETYIKDQLDALERQTYTNIEIIISDNGSTDNTLNRVELWRNSCSRVAHLHHCASKGLNKNFFGALQHVHGEYVIFCDQDDIWLENKVEALVRFYLENKDASLVYCLSIPFSGSCHTQITSSSNRRNNLIGINIRQGILKSFTLGHNLCIKKSVLQQIPVPTNEDVAYDWWITISAMCLGEIKCLPIVFSYWRQHSSNTTSKLIEGKYYKHATKHLKQFLNNSLIKEEDIQWIKTAIECFESLNHQQFSFKLFFFLCNNANDVFFYKTKTNFFAKWISFIKWSFKMSKKNYEA